MTRTLIVILILLAAAEMGDGWIQRDPLPMVVVEMGNIYVMSGQWNMGQNIKKTL